MIKLLTKAQLLVCMLTMLAGVPRYEAGRGVA